MLRCTSWSAAVLFLTLWTLLAAAHPVEGSWSRKQRLTRTPASEDYPRIAVDGCSVHVVWIDLEARDLHYVGSDDAGETWTAPRILASAAELPVIQAEIAASDREVHVVWQQGAHDQARIHHRRSTNGGESWRPAHMLSAFGKASEQPTVAKDDYGVHAAWIQTRRGSDVKPVKPFFSSSSDRGRTWTTPKRVDRRSPGLTSPILVAGGGRLFLFWGRQVNLDGSWTLEINLRASADGGATWLPRRRAVDGGWRPASVGVDGDTIHLAWEEVAYKRSHVRWELSLDGGRTWTARGAPLENDASQPAFGVAGDLLEAVWIDDWDGTGPLVYGRSDDGGGSFSSRRWLDRHARFPALAVVDAGDPCGGVTHLVFGRSWTKNEKLIQEIYYRRRHRDPEE